MILLFSYGLLASLAALPPAQGEASATAPILWSDPGHTLPSFIPEPLLNQQQLDPRLIEPVRMKALSQIEHWLAKQPNGFECSRPIAGDSPAVEPTEDRWPSPLAKIEQGLSAVLCEIQRIVPGWSLSLEAPSSLVEVNVIEVLADSHGQLSDKQPIWFQLPIGVLRVHGATLCSEHPNYYKPALNDQLLLLIRAFDHFNENVAVLGREDIYVVRDGDANIIGPWPPDRTRKFSLIEIKKAGL